MPKWTEESRAKSLISRSSVVTQALKLNEGKLGPESYRELQLLESRAVAAGAAYDVARAAQHAAQVNRDAAERDLSALNSAFLVICRVRGVAASLYEELDRGDPAGLAMHLEAPISRLETIGPMMAEMLRHQTKVLRKCSEHLDPETAKITKPQEELRSVLFRLEAGIALARSQLASIGVVVKFAGKTRYGKKPKGSTGAVSGKTATPAGYAPETGEASGKNGVPANGASSDTQPPAAIVSMGGDGATS